jgi:integrase
MLLTTGMRIDEAVLQKWEYGWGDQGLDFVMLREGTVKGKKRSRPVYFSRALKLDLLRLARITGGQGYIFQGHLKWGRRSRKVESITTRTGERWISEIGILGGLKGLEAHDMRRIYATAYNLLSNETAGDLMGLQLTMGHQKLGTTMIYLVDKLASIARVIEKFAGI